MPGNSLRHIRRIWYQDLGNFIKAPPLHRRKRTRSNGRVAYVGASCFKATRRSNAAWQTTVYRGATDHKDPTNPMVLSWTLEAERRILMFMWSLGPLLFYYYCTCCVLFWGLGGDWTMLGWDWTMKATPANSESSK